MFPTCRCNFVGLTLMLRGTVAVVLCDRQLNHNALITLPAGIFSSSSSLSVLYAVNFPTCRCNFVGLVLMLRDTVAVVLCGRQLNNNALITLPAGIFNPTFSLKRLYAVNLPWLPLHQCFVLTAMARGCGPTCGSVPGN